MDLQAILDAPSSDEDEDNYFQRYAYSCNGGSIVNGVNDGEVDISLPDIDINLSSVSSVKERGVVVGKDDDIGNSEGCRGGGVDEASSPIIEDYQEVDVLSGVSSSPGKQFLKVMDGDAILRDLEEEHIVGHILRSYGRNSRRNSGSNSAHTGSRNWELERILREADANDDDDGVDDEIDDGHRRYASNKNRTSNNKCSDLLLEHILDEDDEDCDSESDKGTLPPSTGTQFNYVNSLSGVSLSGRSAATGSMSGVGIRRLSCLAQLTSRVASDIPLSHSMEVDAILNSVKDDDDNDNLDLEIQNYARHQSLQTSHEGYFNRRGISTPSNTNSDDDTGENDGDIRLNFNFSTGSGTIGGLLHNVKYDDNISMQYPLTRKEINQDYYEQNHICFHDEKQYAFDQHAFKDYTANFLHGIEKQNTTYVHNDGGGNQQRKVSPGTRNDHTDNTSLKMCNADDEQPSGCVSVLCLQHAEAFERWLLQPKTRSIVSPLTVKRRMKPKMELMTKARLSSQSSQTLSTSAHQQHESRQQSTNPKQCQQQPRFCFSGGVIQSKSMTKLGSQLLLKSNNEQSSLAAARGLPTALAINKFIAVGNQIGQVWIFDLFEQLKIILEDSVDAHAGASGSVTSIDLSLHGDFLLAGYGSGYVILWDVIKGSLLKKITDLHLSSISSARLTSMSMAGGSGSGIVGGDKSNEVGAVSIDAGGLVNKLTFSKGMLWSTYSVETECLLDGTAGQILAMDTLSAQMSEQGGQDGMDYHPSVHKIVLIALSSGRSSFAVSVEPKVSVLHRWARPSTERIDPTISEDDRLTQASSAYASTYVSSYAPSYASSYVSTSTYQSNSNVEPKNLETTPVPYLPCLSWGWALISGGGHSLTPILARAWGCSLQFLRAIFPPRDNEYDADNDDATIHWPAFGTHDEFDANAPVVSLNWLGKRSLVYLTLLNEFSIIDTVIMTMQERLDFSGMKLVYAEFALTRSVRQLPSSNGCATFMNSIRSSDNRLLVLCQEEIKEITILGMRQQIISLEDGGQWLEALALALDHYESTVKSQEDNCRSASTSSALKHLDAMVSPDTTLLTEDEIWMAELLMRYLILAIDNAPESSPMEFSFPNKKLPNRLNLAESHFEMLSGVCIEFCIVTRRLDLLFGPIFRCFYEARYINVFLDVMETYVLNDELKYIAPEAMVLFVAHCKDMKDLSMVERCLLHMDCNLMDFDSMLLLLKKNALYTGLFHVYSNGLDDYISPLEILFEAVFDSMETEDVFINRRNDGVPSNKFEQYGYKAILYLQYCFNGKTFPKGDTRIPEERIQTLRLELLDLLFREISVPPQQRTLYMQPQSRHSSFCGIRALSYPYIRALILIDTQAFLHCLEIVFDDPRARFMKRPSKMQTLGSWEVEDKTENIVKQVRSARDGEKKQQLPARQHLVNILSSIIMSDSLVDPSYHLGSRKHLTFLSIKSKHFFLDFVAKYLKLGVIAAPKYLIGEAFIRLCNKRGASEDDVLSLLHAIPSSSYELDEILQTVERVQMTRGALFLHKAGVSMSIDSEDMLEKCQYHFNCSIDCYLSDRNEDFKKGVFSYARKECSGDSMSMLNNIVLQRLPELVILDAVHAAHLVGETFVEEIDVILSSLKGIQSGRIEYRFLHAIISGDLNKVDMVAAQELLANLTMNHHHSYLLLMSKFQPESVYQYLSTNHNYRMNDALELCQKRKITDASAYLLERMGDVSGALKLMLETLYTRMTTLKSILENNDTSVPPSRIINPVMEPKSSITQNGSTVKEISHIKKILFAVLDLCERNKNEHLILENERGPRLWFHVLDRLVSAKALLRISTDSMDHSSVAISTLLSELLLFTMQRMISNVTLYELMHKITRDHSGSDLGEFREMLVSMLKTYSSELDVCSSALDAMYYDIRHMSYEKKRLKVRGSFVQDCPKHIFKGSIIEVGPAGSCKTTSHSHIHRNNHHLLSFDGKTTAQNAVYLLQYCRRSERHQAISTGGRSRQKAKNINLMTSSDSQFLALTKSVARHDIFGVCHSRQVGSLSEAQHVGGLF